jgi:ABC-type transport system substrate-binding protein
VRWLSIALVALVACREPQPELPPDYLRLAGVDEVPTLDPAVGYDTTSWFFEQMLFNTLVDYDDAGELIPELATGWEVSDDGLRYGFRLHGGVRFSHGRPLVAADVKYSLERVLRPHTRSQGIEFFASIAGAADFVAGRALDVAGIERRGDHEILFRLAAPDPLFLHKLALQFAAVVPQEVVDRWGEDFSRHAVGSGPFVLVEWLSGQRLVVRRNPDYFLPGIPQLAGAVRLSGVSDQLGWFKFEAGELDVSAIPPPEFPRVIATPEYGPRLRRETSLRTQYLGLNCALAPFTDVRVRRAISHAINKEKLLRLINNRGVLARGILPPKMPGYDPQLPTYDFNPERARALLAEAGLADGFATTLWARNDEDARRLAQSIQQDLAAVGVRAEIRAIAWGPLLQAVKTEGQVPMFLLGWEADFPDPSNFLEVLFHSKNRGSNNDAFYSNPAVDALLDRAATMVAGDERVALLQQIEGMIMAEAPWVPLYHPVAYQVVQARVRNYRLHPLRPARLDDVSVSDAPSAAAARRLPPDLPAS